MNKSLLPENATAQERALELATARISDVPVPLRDLWDADTCPAPLLPWLAWAVGADEWMASWSDEAKRATIRDAIMVQRRKGTPWAMRRALANAGFGAATIVEGASSASYDGAATYGGFNTHGDGTGWAKYRVMLERPITNSQAFIVRKILTATAPARCQLYDLSYTAVANSYDGATTYNGSFNHGTA